jgi:light-regulated signal transduction histidine kinase (bacteriophytochrome)
MTDVFRAHAAEVAALQAELATVRGELKDFTYTVSHDLRADLRHILAFAEIVQEDAGPQLDAQVQGHLATITASARHMGVLMDGLMEYSRMGTVPLHVAPVQVGPMVAELCQALQAQHPQRVLEWRIADDFPDVRVDATQMRQAMAHLLGNAIKFTATRALATIEVGHHVDLSEGVEPCCTFFVRDNGVGFNPAMQAKLFHVFQRLHSPREFAGIGMGLALTRKMVERHGGTVSAEGAVEGGCCIRMALPRALG